MACASSRAAAGPVRVKAAGTRGTMACGKGLSSSNIQKVPICCAPVSEASVMSRIPPCCRVRIYPARCRFIEHVTYPLCLYPEEHVPDLVDYLWVAAGLSAWEALEGCEDEIRGVFKVENGLHIIKVVSRCVAVLAVLDGHAPLTA